MLMHIPRSSVVANSIACTHSDTSTSSVAHVSSSQPSHGVQQFCLRHWVHSLVSSPSSGSQVGAGKVSLPPVPPVASPALPPVPPEVLPPEPDRPPLPEPPLPDTPAVPPSPPKLSSGSSSTLTTHACAPTPREPKSKPSANVLVQAIVIHPP